MALESHFEVVKLARELHAQPEELDGLAVLPADRIRRLRDLAGDALHERHRHAFERAAAASVLLPAGLTARLAQTLIGPYLSARIAAEMAPSRSIRLASHLDVDFLADVCLSLDPSRVAETVRGLPHAQVVGVGLELLDRGEHITLGKFVDVVAPSVVDAVADRIDDPAALLHIGAAIEARHRLDEVVSRVDDDRLAALVRAAAEHDEMATALSLLSHLGEDNRRRLATLAVEAGEAVLSAVIDTAHAEDAWADVLALLTSVDDEHLAQLASLEGLLTPDRVAELVQAALPRQPLWESFVATVRRIPEDRQRAIAERLMADDEFDVAGLLGLVDLVPSAGDLPLVMALQQEAG